MAHPYAKKTPGRSTAHKRYADGGLVGRLKDGMVGALEQSAIDTKEDMAARMRRERALDINRHWSEGLGPTKGAAARGKLRGQ